MPCQFSTLVPTHRGKGDPLQCGSYRGIKLLEQGTKVLERRLRDRVTIDKIQMKFMPRKETTDAIFVTRQIQEKFIHKNERLFYALWT